MACRIPDNVTDEAAAFGMLGTIALHGVRCADLTFGSTVVVIGLGLLGLLTVQILKAYGCRVLALDVVPSKTELAKQLGAEFATIDSELMQQQVQTITQGQGVDAILITAATKSSEPVDLGIDWSRRGGKVVVVGVADIHPDRNEMWRKEVELIVSQAAGPGSLDPAYARDDLDWPMGAVRWTQKRNLAEFLRLISAGDVNVEPLITHRYTINAAEQAYQEIMDKSAKPIGVILEYSDTLPQLSPVKIAEPVSVDKSDINVSVIGAGLFGKALLLPALQKNTGLSIANISDGIRC